MAAFEVSTEAGQGNTWSLVPLLSGATLCPFNVREEGALGMSTWLQQQGITVYGSSVTLFRSMAKQLPPDGEYPALRVDPRIDPRQALGYRCWTLDAGCREQPWRRRQDSWSAVACGRSDTNPLLAWRPERRVKTE